MKDFDKGEDLTELEKSEISENNSKKEILKSTEKKSNVFIKFIQKIISFN